MAQEIYQELRAPILSGSYPSLRIDTPSDNDDVSLHMDVFEDLYKLYFMPNEHYNFIATETNGEHFVISVLADPNKGSSGHRTLITTKKGYSETLINVSDDPGLHISDRIEKSLLTNDKIEHKGLYPVYNPQFPAEFTKVEEKHSQKRAAMKIGIVYCRKGQTTPPEMFANGINGDQSSDGFWDFVHLLGRQILLEEHTGYFGDMKPPGTTYYNVWNEVEVIYHVAPMLNAEGHRRLIGNDIAVLFFLEEGDDTLFDPSKVAMFGTVPQIFGVVQPYRGAYRVGFFCNMNIKRYGPEIPQTELLEPEYTKNLILTKFFNGLVMANYCPPMNRLFYVPRGATLEGVVSNFPMESRRARRDRERRMKKENRAKEKVDRFGNIAPSLDSAFSNTQVTFENDAEGFSEINAVVMLVASNLAQLDADKAKASIAEQLGFNIENIELFKGAEVQGYIAADDEKIFMSFSGPPLNLKTIKSSLTVTKVPLSVLNPKEITMVGYVHKGYAQCALSIWDKVYDLLNKYYKNQNIWLSGYSLSGAIALFIAHLLFEAKFHSKIAGVYTYGTPKPGDSNWGKTYDLVLKMKTYRVVNSNDMVPSLTPIIPGSSFNHVGVSYHIRSDGQIVKEYKVTTPQTSVTQHQMSNYFTSLFPHHKRALERKYEEGMAKRDRIYSRKRMYSRTDIQPLDVDPSVADELEKVIEESMEDEKLFNTSPSKNLSPTTKSINRNRDRPSFGNTRPSNVNSNTDRKVMARATTAQPSSVKNAARIAVKRVEVEDLEQPTKSKSLSDTQVQSADNDSISALSSLLADVSGGDIDLDNPLTYSRKSLFPTQGLNILATLEGLPGNFEPINEDEALQEEESIRQRMSRQLSKTMTLRPNRVRYDKRAVVEGSVYKGSSSVDIYGTLPRPKSGERDGLNRQSPNLPKNFKTADIDRRSRSLVAADLATLSDNNFPSFTRSVTEVAKQNGKASVRTMLVPAKKSKVSDNDTTKALTQNMESKIAQRQMRRSKSFTNIGNRLEPEEPKTATKTTPYTIKNNDFAYKLKDGEQFSGSAKPTELLLRNNTTTILKPPSRAVPRMLNQAPPKPETPPPNKSTNQTPNRERPNMTQSLDPPNKLPTYALQTTQGLQRTQTSSPQTPTSASQTTQGLQRPAGNPQIPGSALQTTQGLVRTATYSPQGTRNQATGNPQMPASALQTTQGIVRTTAHTPQTSVPLPASTLQTVQGIQRTQTASPQAQLPTNSTAAARRNMRMRSKSLGQMINSDTGDSSSTLLPLLAQLKNCLSALFKIFKALYEADLSNPPQNLSTILSGMERPLDLTVKISDALQKANFKTQPMERRLFSFCGVIPKFKELAVRFKNGGLPHKNFSEGLQRLIKPLTELITLTDGTIKTLSES